MKLHGSPVRNSLIQFTDKANMETIQLKVGNEEQEHAIHEVYKKFLETFGNCIISELKGNTHDEYDTIVNSITSLEKAKARPKSKKPSSEDKPLKRKNKEELKEPSPAKRQKK